MSSSNLFVDKMQSVVVSRTSILVSDMLKVCHIIILKINQIIFQNCQGKDSVTFYLTACSLFNISNIYNNIHVNKANPN